MYDFLLVINSNLGPISHSTAANSNPNDKIILHNDPESIKNLDRYQKLNIYFFVGYERRK